jgi:hypothetical protein
MYRFSLYLLSSSHTLLLLLLSTRFVCQSLPANVCMVPRKAGSSIFSLSLGIIIIIVIVIICVWRDEE